MRFPDRYENGSGRRIHDLLEPALKVSQDGNVLEAAVGKPAAGNPPVTGRAQ
jgi:hypothetical protein